jgi:hypothetical protein
MSVDYMRETTMAANKEEIAELLQQARMQAGKAADQDQPAYYRDAFEALAQAIEKLAEAAGESHHDKVVRAVEEFQGDEGI